MQLQSVTAKLPNCVLFDRAWLPSVSPAKTPRARASVEGGRGTIARRGLSDAADAANRGVVRACRGFERAVACRRCLLRRHRGPGRERRERMRHGGAARCVLCCRRGCSSRQAARRVCQAARSSPGVLACGPGFRKGLSQASWARVAQPRFWAGGPWRGVALTRGRSATEQVRRG